MGAVPRYAQSTLAEYVGRAVRMTSDGPAVFTDARGVPVAMHADPTVAAVLRDERARFSITGEGLLSSRQIAPASPAAKRLVAEHEVGRAGVYDALRAGLSLADAESQRANLRFIDLHLTERAVDAGDIDRRARWAPHAAAALEYIMPAERPIARRFTGAESNVRDLRKARDFARTAAAETRADSSVGSSGFYAREDASFAFGPLTTRQLLGTQTSSPYALELPLTIVHEIEHAAQRPHWVTNAPVVRNLMEASGEYAAVQSLVHANSASPKLARQTMRTAVVANEAAYDLRLRWLMATASWAGMHPVNDAQQLRALLRGGDPWNILDEFATRISRHQGIAREDAATLIQRDIKTVPEYYAFFDDADELGLPSTDDAIDAWFNQTITGPALSAGGVPR